MPLPVSELASRMGIPFQGDGSRIIMRVSSWEAADDSSLIFGEGEAVGRAGGVNAGCVILPPGELPDGLTVLVAENPKLAFARAALLLSPRPRGTGRRSPSAVVSPDASLAEGVDVGPHVVIGAGARIDAGCILHAGAVVGEGCRLGENCLLYPGVVLYPGARLGKRVTVHAGAAIGGDGFGYVFDGRDQVKFPQEGAVEIEDDVEIGCNTTVDRGSLGTTRICAGAKIDNLVQIAHNVYIGRGVVIAAQTGVSGSTVIEDYAVIGGQVGFGDHARVESGAVIGSKAGVLPGKIVRGGEVYWGVPVRPLREYKRLNALFGRLPEFREDIRRLKERLAALESRLGSDRDA